MTGRAGSRSRAADPRPDDTSEIVDTLTEAKDHLLFVQSALGSIRSSSKVRAGLQRRIRAIEDRLADPCHYLAVIGEFNSGKSTLINALIGDTLLTANPWPTTQATTRIRYGEQVVVQCDFRDDDQRYRFPVRRGDPTWRAFAAKIRSVSGEAVPKPADVPALLAVLTAEERVAQAVRTVEIDHPAPVLAEGLVVIDTPGTNAEAGHTEITRRVLADEADAAVVLMAADTPLGTSLAAFLAEALDEHLLARCVFVVTKMVHVDEHDEDGLLDSVRRRITAKLGISDPIVLPVSVGCVVRQLQGRTPSPAEERWITRFTETSQELTAVLERRRAIGVSDRVLRLLDELLKELRRDLKARSATLAREEEALESSDLVDLDEFVARRLSATANDVVRMRAATQRAVDRALDGFEDRLVARTLAAAAGPRNQQRQRIESAVRDQLAVAETACRTGFVHASRTVAEIVAANDRAFAREFAKLAPLGSGGAAPGLRSPSLNAESVSRTSLGEVWALTARHGTTEKALAGGGAAAGILIGSIIFPGVGTVVGALLGAGSALFGTAKRERELRERLRASTHTLATRVRADLADQVAAMSNDGAAAVRKHVDDAARHYRPLVRRLVADHRKREQALRKRRRELDAEIAEIGRRQRRVAAHRKRLATLPRR
jgi:gas vesicle protein